MESKMATKVGNQNIVRKPGYLYYLGKDGYVWASPMRSNKTGKKEKVGTERITREKGYLYYVGTDGGVYRAEMKNVKK